MRNPFAPSPRRTATVPAPRAVPARGVVPGEEFLDPPLRRDDRPAPPEVSLQGIDPRVDSVAAVPAVHLVARPGTGDAACPRSVEELLARPDGHVLRRLVLDVRPFRDVLEARGGWNLLAQLVRDPADRVTNAVFRSAVAEVPAGPSLGRVLEEGDVDADVRIVGEGDSVAGRCRIDLGRARLTLVPLLTSSERVTRRLAEALARPRDRAVRRCLEQALADLLVDRPLGDLVGLHREAPQCAVPGTWRRATSAAGSTPEVAAEATVEAVPVGT
jgi:hypothetical protein